MSFSEWIVEELDDRGWSRSEAARRGGISPSMFDKVINGFSQPGMRFIEGIAKAFEISEHEVFARLYGTDIDNRIVYEVSDMTPEEQREVLSYIQYLRSKKGK